MPEESDPLQSLIADILKAENRGDAVDREAFLRLHPEHADSLRKFFANHDSMKAGSNLEDVTIPPSGPTSAEDVTLPLRQSPHEEATLPPSNGSSRITVRRPTITGRAIRWSRSNRRSLTMIVATSVVAIITFAGYQWGKIRYDAYWTGHVSITLASGQTEISFYREEQPEPVQTLILAADKKKADLPSGDYEIWAERYGQRWKASVPPRQTLELSFMDNDRYDFSLSLGDTGAIDGIFPIRRQSRKDVLTHTRAWHSGDPDMLQLHHGRNGDRLWGVAVSAWSKEYVDGKKPFFRIPVVEITSDFDGDGAGDLAVLKADHYMVVSTESGEVLLDTPLDLFSRYASQVSFGEFMDVNYDGVLDFVLIFASSLLAFDGRDGAIMWGAELPVGFGSPAPEQLLTAAADGEQLLVIVSENGLMKGTIRVYGLSNGALLHQSETEGNQLEAIGILNGGKEPLILVNLDQEFRAIGVSSGRVHWTVSNERWSHFSVRDYGGVPGTLVLEDLTGDGVTDAVMALNDVETIEIMMIDGGRGSAVWRSQLKSTRQHILTSPAVYGESAATLGEVGKLFCVDFDGLPESHVLRLNSINPKTGDLTWQTSLMHSQNTAGVWFRHAVDGSLLPALTIQHRRYGDRGGKDQFLQVDKETGVPFRRLSIDPSFYLTADMDQDGLGDFLSGEEFNKANSSSGAQRTNVSLYRGQPREHWRRPAASYPLSDLNGDDVSDCVSWGLAPTLVSGLTGEALQQLPVVRQIPNRTKVTTGSSGDHRSGLIVQVAEEGYGELNTFVTAIDVVSGKVIAEIHDHLKGYWETNYTNLSPTRLFFPDLDGDGQAEIAVTGNAPWRVYSATSRERLLVGSGLVASPFESAYSPPVLIGFFTGEDGRDGLIEVGSVRPGTQTLPVRVIGESGNAAWTTQLPMRPDSRGISWITGVTTDDFDDDGDPDLILWRGSDLWVLDQRSGKLKLHVPRNGQNTSLAVFMVRTEDARSALADSPGRSLIFSDGEVTIGAHTDVIRYPHPANAGEIYVWIKDDGRIVAYGSDGVTRLWEQRLPEIASTKALGDFLHDGDWNGAAVLRKGDDLFAMDVLTGQPLWRCSSPLKASGTAFLIPRKGYSTPLIMSTLENVTVCSEAYPVDAKWNYLLPSPISVESAMK